MIRGVITSDWEFFFELGREYYEKEAPSMFLGLGYDKESIFRHFIQLTTSKIATVFVYDDGIAKGLIAVGIVPWYANEGVKVANIVHWWVPTKHRGEGVGKALLEAAAGWSREKGAVVLIATDPEAGGPPSEWYESQEFYSLERKRVKLLGDENGN